MNYLCKSFLCYLGIAAILIGPTLQASGSRFQERIDEMVRGQALFHYFQGDELSAITELQLARQNFSTQTRFEESELLLAKLYNNYGLNDEAERLYFQLLAKDSSRSIKNRAWFYLARQNYDRGQYDIAQELLAGIGDDLPVSIESEKQYLLTNIHLKNMLYQKATISAQQINLSSIWRAYANYNLAVSLVDNKFESGKEILEQLGQIPATSAEQSALRDQANLALGLSRLRRANAELALESFSQIRMQGPYSHQALLGAGWAWSQLGEYNRALVPWLELTGKKTIDTATQEAMLAIPATFEQLQRSELAIQYYESAIEQFDQQLDSLDLVIDLIGKDYLIVALLQNDILRATNQISRFPNPAITAPYLHIIMASKSFQDEVDRYQDLLDIRETLGHWNSSLQVLNPMPVNSREKITENLPVTRVTDLSQDRNTDLEQRIDGQGLRVNSLYQRVNELIKQQEIRINQLAVNTIQDQQENIIQLQLSARYSLARLYDSQVSE